MGRDLQAAGKKRKRWLWCMETYDAKIKSPLKKLT
jgi:hypothetical protein